MVYAKDKWFTLTWNGLKRKTEVAQSIGKWFNVIWNGLTNGRLIESNHKRPSETTNGLKGTQMLQSTKKGLDLIWNGLCKVKMVFPNAKWRKEKQMVCGDNTRFNALCDIQHFVEQPNVKWNSPWHHHDIENLKCGAKAACLQPGFHLTFVHYR